MADISISISLGGREFKISRLTIRQSRDLRIGEDIFREDKRPPYEALYEHCVKKIHTAISKSHPDVTEDEIWDIDASEDEVFAAAEKIVIFAGFKSAEPSIAQLRATVAAKTKELADLEAKLLEREAKAKQTGEESAVVPGAA